MTSRRRARLFPVASALVAFLLGASPAAAAFQNNFDLYPAGAQSCLYTASDASNCNGETVAAMNRCLCSNGGNFVLAAAECIGKKSPSDVAPTYSFMSLNCRGSNTPLTVTEAEFSEAAGIPTTTTTRRTTASRTATRTTDTTSDSTTASSTTSSTTQSASVVTTVSGGVTVTITSTPTSSPQPPDSSGGLGTGATVGIVAASVVAVLIVGAVLFFYIRKRRGGDSKEEARPMLSDPSPYQGQTSGVAAAIEHSPRPSELGTVAYYDNAGSKQESKPGWRPTSTLPSTTPSPGPQTPSWSNGQQTWDAAAAGTTFPAATAAAAAHQQHRQSWAASPSQQQQGWVAPPAQQWHQPPATYAELPPQTVADHQRQNVYELASITPQAPPPPRFDAVEMPASPAPVGAYPVQQGQHGQQQYGQYPGQHQGQQYGQYGQQQQQQGHPYPGQWRQ